MNVIGHGISLMDVSYINDINRQQRQYLELHCLTVGERNLARLRIQRLQYLASRLAAKNAVLQALERRETQPILWLEIEIKKLPTGKPFVVLYGNTLKVATERGIIKWLLSISHTPHYATASAIALGELENQRSPVRI
ncbi:MAG: holo-[acyl-carrier-protein] synthase [Cyanobacteria bacterium P01_A01_bin.40]